MTKFILGGYIFGLFALALADVGRMPINPPQPFSSAAQRRLRDACMTLKRRYPQHSPREKRNDLPH